MREINPELQARLDGGATRLCRCWRVERRDGHVMGFTDHDEDVTFDGVTFRAGSGMNASALQTATGLSVDNAQASGALSDAAISEADIRAGRYDGASIRHWLVDWERPDLRVLMFVGSFGEIKRLDHAFEVELRGLAEPLNAPVGRTILRTCDRALGDERCRFDTTAEGFVGEGIVVEGGVAGAILAGGLAGFAAGWFNAGILTWLTGANAGERQTVKADRKTANGREIWPWQAPGHAIAVGDRFRVVAGCDKSADTCRKKFSNFVNFRGFPHLPGEDWVTAYPADGALHDGSSQQI
jgi:uncharacterized phage protein (TIGR02218 family)